MSAASTAATCDDARPVIAYLDAIGGAHPRVTAPPRIVSLVPSITELLCDLDLAGMLVGRTGFCIHPRETVKRIPKIGGTKDVDLDAVRRLAPTHAIVNVDENTRETADALRTCVPHVIVTHPLGPLDNPSLFRLLGGIFDREAAADALCAAFESTLADVRDRCDARERVLYLIWRDPWMTVSRNTYISRMLALHGWDTWPVTSAQRYPTLALEDVRGGVDRVLLSSEPYPFRSKHLLEVQRLLPRVPVAMIDGEMVSWYGSRAIAGLRYLGDFVRRARETVQTLDH
ncbi:MAG: ABC transporter substrate-binding protein [Gammaproteobacteria bacterium]|nr:ABC transporter substrate-binding protein [Gammaproteobacteria bacterium]